jgi:hypothetical protein
MSDFDDLHVDFDKLNPNNKSGAAAEVEQIGDNPVIVLSLGVVPTLALLGAVQLALRHAAFRGRPTHALVEEIGRRLHDSLRPFPEIEKAAAAGWNPVFDYQPETTVPIRKPAVKSITLLLRILDASGGTAHLADVVPVMVGFGWKTFSSDPGKQADSLKRMARNFAEWILLRGDLLTITVAGRVALAVAEREIEKEGDVDATAELDSRGDGA